MTYDEFENFEARAERAKVDALKREQRRDDLSALMALPQGRRFIHGELERRGVFRTTFSPDPYTTAFAEGRRSAGLELLAEAQESAPRLYINMLSEAEATHDRYSSGKHDSSG